MHLRPFSVLTCLVTSLLAPASAQLAPPLVPNWQFGALKLSGLVDVYADFAPNHPASRTIPFHNFDVRANSASLNMAKFALERDPAPFGFRADFGFGRAFELFNFQDAANGFNAMRYLPQAYFSFRPRNGAGLQLDFGKFYTSAGAELTETHLGWNYSRSLLYANGPYYHFGARLTKPLTKSWTAGVQLVNGWNNVKDTNAAKTLGLTSSFNLGKAAYSVNYYAGAEPTPTGNGMRHFIDQVFTLAPTNNLQLYLNFDYGHQALPNSQPALTWWGFATAARLALSKNWAISPRAEFFRDARGFITATPQNLKSFTITGERRLGDMFITRLEYRRDWSNQPVFERGALPGSFYHGDTFLIGMVTSFGPKPQP
jgi:hypothetical protein